MPKISRVNLVNLESKNNAQKPQIKKDPLINHLDPFYIMNFMTNTAPRLSFRGATLNFDQTIERNFFQLPLIKRADGTQVQAMPDKTQLACAKSLYDGNNTVCIAPTGTGKTAIANYIITKNLEAGKKTFYTTPLKALSNDKYREFCKLYGEENVGLLTGDIKIKKGAPVVIMTTEIYRNMTLGDYANPAKDRFKGVQTLVFDEAHYLNDKERGKIWEESIMMTPKHIQILPLSATIGNGKQFASWIGQVTGKTTNLVEASPKDRYVPLVYYNFSPSKDSGGFKEIIKGQIDTGKLMQAYKDDTLSQRQSRALDTITRRKYRKDDDYTPTKTEKERVLALLLNLAGKSPISNERFLPLAKKEFHLSPLEAQEVTQLLIDSDTKEIKGIKDDFVKGNRNDYQILVQALKVENKLPAIIFAFSHSACENSASTLYQKGVDLTTDEEKEQIKAIIQQYQEKGIYLGKNFRPREIISGYGAHHAGLLPSHKKLVEDLFSRKLLKVVFATSTLSAGINMPARSVVISDINKPTEILGEDDAKRVPLTSNEFHQMCGRAGRRGVDTIGNVILYNLHQKDKEIAQSLILRKPNPLISKFTPSYNFLTSYYERNEGDTLLNYFEENTFHIYQAQDKDKAIQELKEEFEKYRNVLIKEGFLEQTEHGYITTPKGKMLTKAHGYNELTLVSMISSGKLKDLTPEEIAAYAASMAGSSYEQENETGEEFVKNLMFHFLKDGFDKTNFFNVLDEAVKLDDLRAADEIMYDFSGDTSNTNMLSGYLGYKWAMLNSQNKDDEKQSIENFKSLSATPANVEGKNMTGKNVYADLGKRLEDGNIYRVLSQSVDVLKQIINISEFALESEEFKNQRSYYKDLIEKAQKALELVKKPPVYDALSVA